LAKKGLSQKKYGFQNRLSIFVVIQIDAYNAPSQIHFKDFNVISLGIVERPDNLYKPIIKAEGVTPESNRSFCGVGSWR